MSNVPESQPLMSQCIRAMREIEAAMVSGLDLRGLLKLILEKIDFLLPSSVGATMILVLDRDTGMLEPLAYRSLDEEGQGISNREMWALTAKPVLEAKTPLTILDLQTGDPGWDPGFFRRKGLVSYLGVPLIADGKVLGVLAIYTKNEYQFGNEELEFFSAFSTQAVSAIRHRELYERTQNRLTELENENNLRDQLLNVLSKDIRTPLNSVVGYAGLLRDKTFGEINPNQENALAGVMRSCQDQLNMVNKVLEVLKTDSLKDEVLTGSCSLNEAVDAFERELIWRALQKTGFNQAKTASLLGITRRILRYKMEKLKLRESP